jgi:hypothetical protein
MLAIVVFVPCDGPFLRRILWNQLLHPPDVRSPHHGKTDIVLCITKKLHMSRIEKLNSGDGEKCEIYKLFGKITVV